MFPNRIYWPRTILLCANIGIPILTIAAGFPWPMMWTAFCVHGALIFALLVPCCNWLAPLATRFDAAGREVWLTIDDGPDGNNTVQLARALADRQVRATFFVKGKMLAAQPDAGRAILAGGHTLANHTATHPLAQFSYLTRTRLREEIDQCNDSLREAGVAIRRWFRPPLGLKHIFLHPELARRGMRLVAWSARARDGIPTAPETVVRRVAARATPGAIIVLHEGMPQSNETILQVVDSLRAQGYSFIIPADDRLW